MAIVKDAGAMLSAAVEHRDMTVELTVDVHVPGQFSAPRPPLADTNRDLNKKPSCGNMLLCL